MTAKKRSAAKKSKAKKLPPIPRGPDPFRETVEIARGPNESGLSDMTHAAHGIDPGAAPPATDLPADVPATSAEPET